MQKSPSGNEPCTSHHVVSDINGQDLACGSWTLFLAGRARTPRRWSNCATSRISKSTVAEMEEALKGDYRPEQPLRPEAEP